MTTDIEIRSRDNFRLVVGSRVTGDSGFRRGTITHITDGDVDRHPIVHVEWDDTPGEEDDYVAEPKSMFTYHYVDDLYVI